MQVHIPLHIRCTSYWYDFFSMFTHLLEKKTWDLYRCTYTLTHQIPHEAKINSIHPLCTYIYIHRLVIVYFWQIVISVLNGLKVSPRKFQWCMLFQHVLYGEVPLMWPLRNKVNQRWFWTDFSELQANNRLWALKYVPDLDRDIWH